MNTEEYILEAKPRDQKLKAARIRAEGQIPVVLYGKGVETTPLTVDGRTFRKIFHKAGESSLINLKVEGGDSKFILLRDPQYDPRTNDLVHVDFYQVNLAEKIRAEVPLTFIGEAPIMDTHEATLITNKDKVEVECLPRELPHEIEVDLSGLVNIDDTILVKDLKVPAGVEILNDGEESVVLVTHQAAEEEVVVAEADAVAGVEVTSEKPEAEGAES